MARRKLKRVIPVRVEDRDVADLRRWAREDPEADGNVSVVVRRMIRDRREQLAAAVVAGRAA